MNLIRLSNTKISKVPTLIMNKKLIVNINLDFATLLGREFEIRLDDYLNLDHYNI
jgi:hypothetical protein